MDDKKKVDGDGTMLMGLAIAVAEAAGITPKKLAESFAKNARSTNYLMEFTTEVVALQLEEMKNKKK